MNLDDYKRWYAIDEGHWYVSKVKQYNPASIQQFAKIMRLLVNVFSRQNSPELYQRFQEFKPKVNKLFDDDIGQIRIDSISTLFVSILVLKEGLVDMAHLRETNSPKYKIFNKILSEFLEGKDYSFFAKKYKVPYLTKELIIYYRNFKSWLGKYGFWGESSNKLGFITDIGREFANNCDDIKVSSAIFEHQLKKYQIWNPTIDEQYRDSKYRTKVT